MTKKPRVKAPTFLHIYKYFDNYFIIYTISSTKQLSKVRVNNLLNGSSYRDRGKNIIKTF